MKYLTLLLFLSFFASTVCSQVKFAPLGATWEYHYIEGWTSDTGTLRVVYSGDTTIFGKTSKRLCVTKEPSIFFPDACAYGPVQQLFIAQSNDSVFLSFDLSFFIYVFKLNYNVSDTVTFPMLYGPRKFEVTKTDTLFFNNQPIRRFNIHHKSPPFLGGSLQTFVFDLFGPELSFFGSWWGNAVDGDSYFLCSYQHDGFPKIYLSGAHCSETVNISSMEENALNFILSPNPTIDLLEFSCTGKLPSLPVQITIYDPHGRLVLREIFTGNHASFDVSHLQSGLYFAVVQLGDAIIQQKFVKY